LPSRSPKNSGSVSTTTIVVWFWLHRPPPHSQPAPAHTHRARPRITSLGKHCRVQREVGLTEDQIHAPFGNVHGRLLGDEPFQNLVVGEEGELVGDLAAHGARRGRLGQVEPRHTVVSGESAQEPGRKPSTRNPSDAVVHPVARVGGWVKRIAERGTGTHFLNIGAQCSCSRASDFSTRNGCASRAHTPH
jgi:hypothetical protein